MKKEYYLMASIAFMIFIVVAIAGSMKQSSIKDKKQDKVEKTLTSAEKNAIEFLRNHVSKKAPISEMQIISHDTLLYGEMPELIDSLWEINSRKENHRFTDKSIDILHDVHTSWFGRRYENDRLKLKPEYDDYWRDVYHIQINVGEAIKLISVIMDKTGENAVETEYEYFERMNNKKCNNLYDDYYCFEFK